MSTRPYPKRQRTHWISPALYVLVIAVVAGGFGALWWVKTLPERVDEQQTIVVGPSRLAPDSDASVRVIVQDFGAGKPIAGAQVRVSLAASAGRSVLLFEGRTDETGSLPVRFHVPADAPSEATLIVETRSGAGRDRVEQSLTVVREYRLLLSSDKPLYQPGQTIHMRALALSALDLVPARGTRVDFLVEDPKGNKVFRQSEVASDFGVVAADFGLGDLVNQGDYKLSVAIGDTRSEKTVEVRPYVLPKFGVNVSTDRSYYLPGQRVEGVVQADYFYGKPVAGGQVQVVGTVWDVGRTVVVDLAGQTDEDGTYSFQFSLPEHLVGSGLDTGQAQFALEVAVIDQTDHAEQTSRALPVAAQPLTIEAVAESGVLKPGVENLVYLLTAYPDGRPAPTRMQISVDGKPAVTVESGEFGLASYAITPESGRAHVLSVSAQDETGLAAYREIVLEADLAGDAVLLRADRAAYVVGETMNLVVLTPVGSGDVYLDIVKSGQTLSTRSTPVKDGRAEFAVDVSSDLLGPGTLELHAYKVLLDGTVVRDTRLVVVDAPNDIPISIGSDADVYLPGDTATINFETAGVQAALAVAVVDESVFALQRQDPGFAKLYFMLEQELLEPFYQVQGFELPAALPPDREHVRTAQDDAAKAVWAGALSAPAARALNSRPQKMVAVREARRRGLKRIGQASAIGMVVVPLSLWGVALVALGRARVIGRSLLRLVISGGVLLLIGGCLAGWLLVAERVLYRLDLEGVLIPLAVLLGIAILAFVSYAFLSKDSGARLFALLTLAWGALLFLMVQASRAGPEPEEGLLIAVVLAYLLIPGAYLLFGQGRWVEARRAIGALATGVGVLSIVPALAIVPSFFLLSSGAFSAAAPTLGLEGRMGFDDAQVVREVMVEVEKAVEVEEIKEAEAVAGDRGSQGAAPRLRQYFPETLYWAPEVVTDEGGHVSLEIPMADSITTWRLTALASSQDGRLGYATRGIRVFQDFFVDLDLPVALTQGDEISIPVGVFNYLADAQEVRLVVEPESWFELLGPAERTLNIAPNDIEVVYFAIRVVEFGRQGLQVTAWGSRESDAIRRQVTVVPDGKEVRLTESDWLRESKEMVIDIPAYAVEGTSRVEVKIYPGVMAQVIEGLEKILRLPHG